MKIYIDRRNCNCWAAACETCFSWHYMDEEIRPNYCLLDVVEDNSPARTFYIKDRDGVDKVFVVDEDNWEDVQDTWMLTFQREQGLQASS